MTPTQPIPTPGADDCDWLPPLPRKRGRRTKLTPELRENFCRLIADYNLPLHVICQAVGISQSSVTVWQTRGRAAASGIYYDFVMAVEQARARFEKRQLDNILRAATEGEIVTRRVERVLPDGSVTVETTEERKTTWQAAKFLLERRIPERYSEKLAIDQQIALTEQPDRKVVFEFHGAAGGDDTGERLVEDVAASNGSTPGVG